MTPERAEQIIDKYVAACERGDPRALAIHREIGEEVRAARVARKARKKSKIYHMAGLVREDGATSAKCFDPPRPIDLTRESWTLIPENVTCKKCLALLAQDAQKQ